MDNIIIEEAQMIRFYNIVSDMGNMIYTGSTELTIKQRFGIHKSGYKLWKNCKTGHTTSYDLFDKYGFENCKIVEISSQICNKATRDAVEAGRILLHRADVTRISVNNRLPGAWTGIEMKQYQKRYWDDNAETIKAHKNEKHICDKCNGKYTNSGKS